MPAIRLWYSPGACSFVPHVLLHELGLAFQPMRVPIREGALQTEEFGRLNPKRRVPVLALDQEVITELPAIATALSLLKPERHMMGKDLIDQARVYEWMNWLSGTVHAQGFGCFWRPQRFSDDQGAHESIIARGRKTIAEYFGMIDAKLVRPHAVGDDLTAVDVFLLVFYRWGNVIGIDMASAYSNFARFAERHADRPSVVKVLATEGIKLEGAT
jgi:glutathione S-transferase